MVQVVELLQSKYKALSSNPSTIKKEGKKKKKVLTGQNGSRL
jgi:hypothetical protein